MENKNHDILQELFNNVKLQKASASFTSSVMEKIAAREIAIAKANKRNLIIFIFTLFAAAIAPAIFILANYRHEIISYLMPTLYRITFKISHLLHPDILIPAIKTIAISTLLFFGLFTYKLRQISIAGEKKIEA